jgi:hypothetical protein
MNRELLEARRDLYLYRERVARIGAGVALAPVLLVMTLAFRSGSIDSNLISGLASLILIFGSIATLLAVDLSMSARVALHVALKILAGVGSVDSESLIAAETSYKGGKKREVLWGSVYFYGLLFEYCALFVIMIFVIWR